MIGLQQLLPHNCSEKMKCVVVDCLKNEKAQVLFGDSTFLLYKYQTNQANLHLFNAQFTAITHTFKIAQLDSIACCTSVRKQNKFFFLHSSKNKIIVNKFEEKEGEFAYISQQCRVECKFQGKDGFKLLSPSMSLNEKEQAILAYSKNDQFYLILCAYKDKRVVVSVSKLADLDRPSGVLSWIMRQKPNHYEEVKIVPLFADEINRLKVLCIRDNSIGVFQIRYNDASSIKQLYSSAAFNKTIKSSDTLLSAKIISPTSVLLAYDLSSKLTLIKLNIIDNQSCITFDTFKTQIAANSLQMHVCNQSIYINVRESTMRYQCYKQPLGKMQNLVNKDCEAMIARKQPMWLAGNTKQLFLIHSHHVYVLEQLHHLKGHIHDQLRRFQSYQNWIDRTLNKRIRKHVQQESYDQLACAYQEKEQKLIEQFNHLKKRNIQNQQINGKITEQIICSAIVRALMIKRQPLQQIAQKLKEDASSNGPVEQDFLDEALIKATPIKIKHLLTMIVKMGIYNYLNEILEEINKHQLKQHCQKTIREVFSQACQQAIFSLQKITGHKYELKMLLQLAVTFIEVKEGKFVDTFMQLAKDKDQHQFIHNFVLNHKLIRIFMHLFIYTDIPFAAKDVEQIMNFIEDQIIMHKYLSQFLYRLRQSYLIGSSREEAIRKMGILMKGLQPCLERIENIVNKYFPGLCVYLYLNSQNRKHYTTQIKQIAKKCSQPFASYMLELSTFDKKKSSIQTLAKIRLCQELQQPYNQSQDILLSLQSGKFSKEAIRRHIWQNSKSVLEIGPERANGITEKVKII